MSEYEHKVYMEVMAAVKKLTDEMIAKANLDSTGENNVRMLLNENMRFWK